ncbi:recombinase RecT [Leucobacter sp. USCH14]|uniref:RecT family recombinase n=1 Tax=Leucobacter sp. USCH14 TaxID=3024838 RepID=UPI0030B64AFB
MSTALAERNDTETNLAIATDQKFFNEAQRAALVQMGLGDAPRGDIEAFFHQAKRSGLDPFARQIYMIGRRSKQGNNWVTKYTIQTSIDGFRVIRDRKGTFRGMEEHWCGTDGAWRDVWLENTPPAAARITLYLDGFVKPITAVARYDEYVPLRNGEPTGQWGKMPALMTSKVAEALALRKAYPQDYSGLYTSDEMAQADTPRQSETPPKPAPRPEAEPDPVEAEVVNEPEFNQAAWVDRIQQCLKADDVAIGVDMLRTLHGEAKEAGLLRTVLVEDLTFDQVLRQAKAELEARGQE